MKKIFLMLLMASFASVFAQETCAPCDCDSRTPELKAESSKEEIVEKGGIALAAAAAGALLHKKFSCDRFDIIVEYKLMDACLNSCSGKASVAARTEKCARAIQDFECKKKLGAAEVAAAVENTCPY